MSKLSYVILDSTKFPRSTDVLQSDYVENALLQEQISGTLVSYQEGEYIPYLSSSYKVRNEGLRYEFIIRSGLKSDLGKEISPSTIKDSITAQIKKYLKFTEPPLFKYLEGFKDFQENNKSNIRGISVKENKLIFKFTQKPIGILNYFAMPYFGLHYKNSSKGIDSTAGYRVKQILENEIILEKRLNWPLNKESSSPNEVSIKLLKDVKNVAEENVIVSLMSEDINYPNEKFDLSETIPMMGTILNISHEKEDQVFKGLAAKELNNLITMYKRDNPIVDKYFSDSIFYKPNRKDNVEKIELGKFDFNGKEISLVWRGYSKDQKNSWLLKLIDKIEQHFNVKIKIIEFDKDDPEWFIKERSNKYFDLKLVTVHIGDTPFQWLVDLIFCSRLGASLSDYGGEICNLISKYQEEDVGIFANLFDKAMEKNWPVIPLYFDSYKFLISKQLNINLPKSEINVRFEFL